MRNLNIAMIGTEFMGRAHSNAWSTAPQVAELEYNLVKKVIVGRSQEKTDKARISLGWEESSVDWKTVIQRSDIDIVDICVPGDLHAQIAIAALETGKHVICEKPLANSLNDAISMFEAAKNASTHGVKSMVSFNYRRIPAISLAREMIQDGDIGEIRQVRSLYLQDWAASPDVPMSWRFRVEESGSGALGDIGAHLVDLVHYLTGARLESIFGATERFVESRPSSSNQSEPVTVDDAAIFFGYLPNRALCTFEATRMAWGRKNAIRIEINGTKGSLAFDFEDMNVLEFYDAQEASSRAGFRRILVTEPEHPYIEHWWPAGHGLGYEHGFVHQIIDAIRDLNSAKEWSPSFEDGLYVQEILAAVMMSAESSDSKMLNI